MENKQFFESSKQKQSDLYERVDRCVLNNAPIEGRLEYDLANAKRSEISWELFYRILESPQEALHGYWNATNVACILLMPVIRSTFSTSKNNRINENVEEDFLSEVRMEIQKCIPGFDKEKSHFPNYVKNYIMHVGYVHDKDSSTYMEKKKGIRIFGQGALATNDEEKETLGDPYAQTKSSFAMEEELEKRERAKSSQLFANYIGKYKPSVEARVKKEMLINQTIELSKKLEELNSKNEEDYSEDDDQRKQELIKVLSKNDKAISDANKIIEKDPNQLFINTCFWDKFLGGMSNLPIQVKESIYERDLLEEER